MAERSVTQSLTPLRRRENAAISGGIEGENILALPGEKRGLAATMVAVTRLLDPRLRLLILKGAGYPVEGDVRTITRMETTIERED